MQERYDVVVVGGGPAGLSGALTLARSRRTVLVVDAGEPRNAPAHGVHVLLGHDGLPPRELLARGRAELASYGGETVEGEVVGAEPGDGGFVVRLRDGRTVRARRLLVTTGLVDELPDVPGLAEHWGGDVVHCPYCHGWEVRDRAIGVLATGPASVHQAMLFSQLSDDVVLFAAEALEQADVARLTARGVAIVHGEVVGVESEEGRISGVRLADGTTVPREVLAVATRMRARADFLAGVGLTAVPHPAGIGDYVPSETGGRTEVPGVHVAGNVTDPMAQVGASGAAGVLAGALINAELVEEDALIPR